MPRHRGVGMNRAIKRKVSWLEPAQEEVINAEEPEDQTRATSQEPGPSSSPLPRSEPEVSELSWRARGEHRALVEELHVQLLQAQRHLKVIERRWEKKKKTYHEGSKNSCWAALSVTQRCEARMFEADKELGEARAWMVHWNRGWRLAQSSYTVTKRCLRNPGNEVDTQLLWWAHDLLRGTLMACRIGSPCGLDCGRTFGIGMHASLGSASHGG